MSANEMGKDKGPGADVGNFEPGARGGCFAYRASSVVALWGAMVSSLLTSLTAPR